MMTAVMVVLLCIGACIMFKLMYNDFKYTVRLRSATTPAKYTAAEIAYVDEDVECSSCPDADEVDAQVAEVQPTESSEPTVQPPAVEQPAETQKQAPDLTGWTAFARGRVLTYYQYADGWYRLWFPSEPGDQPPMYQKKIGDTWIDSDKLTDEQHRQDPETSLYRVKCNQPFRRNDSVLVMDRNNTYFDMHGSVARYDNQTGVVVVDFNDATQDFNAHELAPYYRYYSVKSLQYYVDRCVKNTAFVTTMISLCRMVRTYMPKDTPDVQFERISNCNQRRDPHLVRLKPALKLFDLRYRNYKLGLCTDVFNVSKYVLDAEGCRREWRLLEDSITVHLHLGNPDPETQHMLRTFHDKLSHENVQKQVAELLADKGDAPATQGTGT